MRVPRNDCQRVLPREMPCQASDVGSTPGGLGFVVEGEEKDALCRRLDPPACEDQRNRPEQDAKVLEE